MKGNIFIKRPVMAMSIAIVILILGAISYFNLPVEQYPDIAPPTVVVRASYPGASAETVTKAVIQPLEESINGVEDMIYMTSTATNSGSASIAVYFKQGTNPDMAAVNVQNRASIAQGLLPQEVTMIGVTTLKRQTSMLQINSIVSDVPEYDANFMANYMNINVTPQLKRVQGVGEVNVLGASYSLRVWLKPEVMAQYSLVPSDITACLAEQNLEAAIGKLGEKPMEGGHGKNVDNVYEYTLRYTGRLKEVEEFKNIVIVAKADGTVLRLKDIADVELGQESYGYSGRLDGKPSVQFMAYQLAGANAKETNDRFSAALKEMNKTLPKGIHFEQMMSTNDFLLESIANVEETLVIAILLVILVVYFFLQDFKATMIPSISIVISLVGTFAALQLAGFTLNLLTLFALVLAIGTVVDDAIVVVEAVQAKFDAGYTSAYQATKDAMSDVTMAVISCTFVFMAVFIPVTMMGGTSGVFYTQFGVTLATAVGISCISALVVCPALCAMLMRPAKKDRTAKNGINAFFIGLNKRTRTAYEASFGAIMSKYTRRLRSIVNHRWVAPVAFGIACVLLAFFMSDLPKGLVPQEDQGVLMVNVTCPPGSNLAYTESVLDRVYDIVKKDEDIKNIARTSGFSFMGGQGAANAMLILRMQHWNKRPGLKHSTTVKKLLLMLELMQEIPEAQIFVFEPGMIPGYGMGSNVDLHLQDRNDGDKDEFLKLTEEYLAALNERPEIQRAMTSYARNFPQYQVEIDAAQCKRAGISPSQVLSAMSGYLGGAYVSNFNQYGKVYRVMLQTDPKYRTSPADVSNMYVRNGKEMAPITQFAKLKPVLGPEIDTHFNLFSEISCMIQPAQGYSVGDAMQAIDEVHKKMMPEHITYEYGGISREEYEQMGSNQTILIYAICVVLIFLILSCLYESFLVPFAVILSVPAGLMGSFGFAWLWNLVSGGAGRALTGANMYIFGQIENNIYLQTGVIMLIGLLAKTAILITEFALERRRKGMGIVQAAYAACEARLRPILMTVFTCVLGMLPLLFASGAGANGNRTIGVGVVGGMIVGTVAILFTVPVFFIFFEWLQEKIRPVMKVEADQQFLKEQERSLLEKREAAEDK
ncbi:MAG: efflux RND transporter permease subunit [Bacteroidaceae bacterium]|nr:efflux RND transporter permease subunit [Bacteroidaceae bacterium]